MLKAASAAFILPVNINEHSTNRIIDDAVSDVF